MTAPPVVDPPELQQRNFTGWLVLLALFIFIIISSSVKTEANRAKSDFVTEKAQLRGIYLARAMSDRLAELGLKSAKVDEASMLKPLIEKLRLHRAEPAGVGLYVQVLTEAGKRPTADDIRILSKSGPYGPVYVRIYGPEPLTEPQAQALLDRLPDHGAETPLVRVHALEKAGDRSARASLVSPGQLVFMALRGAAIIVILLSCGLLWGYFYFARASGQLRPKGLPLLPRTLLDADSFAVRASLLFAVFFVGSNLLVSLATVLHIDARLGQIACAVMIVAMVGWMFSRPILGRLVTLRDLGIARADLGRNMLYGLAGFAMELPLTLLLTVLVTHWLTFLPTPTHPAATELMQHRDFFTVGTTLLFGAVAAPIWEEVAFRGLLFPALAKWTKSIPMGALISSFAFAAIHPQGLAGIVGLMTVALVSCTLAYQTKSLVPSITMHAVHNFVLLIATAYGS